MKLLLLFSVVLFVKPVNTNMSDQIIGKWLSQDKDLIVEVFKKSDHYGARVVWFDCSAPNAGKMSDHLDTHNPDPAKRTRPWLGMVVVDDLKYFGKNEWNGGNIYDPNSGHTFKSVVRLSSPQNLIVRGYWGFELLGKNITFTRLPDKV